MTAAHRLKASSLSFRRLWSWRQHLCPSVQSSHDFDSAHPLTVFGASNACTGASSHHISVYSTRLLSPCSVHDVRVRPPDPGRDDPPIQLRCFPLPVGRATLSEASEGKSGVVPIPLFEAPVHAHLVGVDRVPARRFLQPTFLALRHPCLVVLTQCPSCEEILV
jgi:hypothetical protein